MTAASTTVRTAAAVASLGTILGVWAHPDDEAYLSGGLMALARDAGLRVVCVTATRGELGTSDPVSWPPSRLASERTGELAHSLGILGVHEHRWLGYADGGCGEVDAGCAVARLAAIIDEVGPRTVLSFGPDGQTGHPDHRAVSAWTTAAFDKAARRGARLLHTAVEEGWARRWGPVNDRLGVFLGTEPETVPAHRLTVDLRLRGDTLDRKVRALRAQATQTHGVVSVLGAGTYSEWVAAEAFVAAAGEPA
jgi:LmbE family N-acetylglucosaminyl deacetylase